MANEGTARINPKQVRKSNTWSLINLPPEGDPDVGAYFFQLYQGALQERQRLGLKERWLDNYRHFRPGNSMAVDLLPGVKRGKTKKLSLSILTANVQRTVANITARAPQATAHSADGGNTDFDDALTQKLKIWNNSENQQESLGRSVTQQEVYGVTLEKMVYHRRNGTPDAVVLDPLAYLQAPGHYKTPNDAPYVIHQYTMNTSVAERKYGVNGISAEDAYSVLGEERERDRIVPTGTTEHSINASGNYLPTQHPGPGGRPSLQDNCLVIEIWIRDYSTFTEIEYEPVIDEETGMQVVDPETEEPVFEEVRTEKYRYPGNIRVVTLTNQGHVVLDDRMNPNINPELSQQLVERTYLYDKFPFFKGVSYEDPHSPWGFSMAELVGDVNMAIDDLWNTITSYLRMALHPPLILPRDTGLNESHVRYTPRLVLKPNSYQTSLGIRWLDMPTPPSWLFQALNTLLTFFDRISQIEDAQRGEQPGGVIAASAIQQLQERSAVLVRAKIRAVDHIVRERGRCFISFYQNFGTGIENVEVNGTVKPIQGVALAGLDFEYMVESGSTVARTESQEQQQAVQLYQLGAIDRQALLETLNFRDWKEVVERMGESDLDTALNILVQSGLPEEQAIQLKQVLMQSQGGPGNTQQQQQGGSTQGPGAPSKPGTPKAEQGQNTGTGQSS